MLLPIVLCGGLSLASFIAEKTKLFKFSWNDAIKYICLVLFALYPTVSNTVLGMFKCHTLGTFHEELYLAKDFAVHCDDHFVQVAEGHLLPALFFSILYPLGIPVFFFVMLSREAQLYHPVTLEPAEAAFKKLGGLYASYEPRFYYWEVVVCFHKVVLCGLLQYIGPGTPTQILFVLVFTVFYQACIGYFQPYRFDSDDFSAAMASDTL